MGNVSSRLGEEGNTPYLKDQSRLSITTLTITNSRNRTLLHITPNGFPVTKYIAKRDVGDDSVIEYVQDPESPSSTASPSFLLRLSNDEDLIFNFTFVVRQTQPDAPISSVTSGTPVTSPAPLDTTLTGLTYIFGSSTKDIDNLVTREFHADPNLHKNPNVQLVGDYSTGESQSVQFQWTWKWRPPKSTEDRGGGWRNCCSFVEYDQRAHKLNTLASFSFWVQNTARLLGSPKSPSPRLDIGLSPRLRVPSAQSIDSRVSDSDGGEYRETFSQHSPAMEPVSENRLGLVPIPTNSTIVTEKFDFACIRPGEDLSAVEDGPVFRATMKAMELKTGNMRSRWKKVLKRAEAAQIAQGECNNAVSALMDALREASLSNSNAVQPAIDHYFDKIAREILAYERQNTVNLQRLIIDPITKLYNVDIKQAESKKRDFEEESSQYYAYMSRYLGQRQDSLKEKKRTETDTKYQSKRRNFELKRFDYSSFMQDLHGGRKDQEVLSHLTKYADAQAKGYLSTAKKIEAMIPQLEALSLEVKEADKEFQIQRTEREEKRRALEKSVPLRDVDLASTGPVPSTPAQANRGRTAMTSEIDATPRSASVAPAFKTIINPPSAGSSPSNSGNPASVSAQGQPLASSVQVPLPVSSPNQNRFKGIRDLEEKNYTSSTGADANGGQYRKEGLLWALSRPGSHVDPKGLNKQAWHKFWIVLDQGKLSEYTNWKEKLDLHMDPIDLRVASVREARNSERRFCFEVISPQFTRVYQATSEDDMRTWISAVNNAIQSAFENKSVAEPVSTESLSSSTRRDIASVLTGKSTSLSSHRGPHQGNHNRVVSRHATVGDKPSYRTLEGLSETPSRLLQQIRDADAANRTCADCGSDSKVEWVSINLGIVLCIECSGIHRSLGTHISKIRSLTLDTNSFTVDIIELLLTVGNRMSNNVWEERLDNALKPGPHSTREQRLHFITAKYSQHAYIQPISSTLSHYSTAEETLLASIKKGDTRNVIYALALGANRNATDRSRNTHAVYLALAAADPAAPSAGASPAASPGPSTSASATPLRKAFPIAEMLLQNGADLPSMPAPFPLSSSAKLYLEQKVAQLSGRPTGVIDYGALPHAGGDGTGDTLTALPNIVAGNGSSPGERAREREQRLQKRVSAGGRLVKSHGV